ncbi:flagellar motor control protein ZomB [Nocardia terpenica]|uniref:flagellar motor control protein ZomB n=1 Tax=Nocardia terpenica TaxID=455432 RepID=UPI001E54D87C|nr:flagellar motor control protein ZomB [Nocardia terpenica]
MLAGDEPEDRTPTTALPIGAARRVALATRRFALLSRATFVGGVTLTVVLFAVGAWQRRWIADDGLIVLRTVRNLLAGNGPVFNAGDRVETNTSAAWTYVIYFFSWVSHARLEYVSLAVALTLSLLAVVFAMLGAARLWGGAAAQLLLPAGALVYIAVPPARDYATSGLENCLVIFWLGVLWYLLIRWSQAARPRPASLAALAFWAGLCWVVRPEMTIVGGLALVMIFCAPVPRSRLRPIVLRALLVAAGGLVPVGYQIWRMGYYGLPVPNTAVAKEASGAKWQQGFTYLWDLVGPYYLWVPLLVLIVVAVLVLRSRRAASRRADVPAAADGESADDKPTSTRERLRRLQIRLRTPGAVVTLILVCTALLIVYNIRVGGDFMHGRMLLPQLFCLLLPVSVLPVRLPSRQADSWSLALPLVAWAATVGWALFAADQDSPDAGSTITASGIVDERVYYVLNSGHSHPILAEDYLDYPRMRAMVRDIERTPDGGLLLSSPSFMSWYLAPPPLPIPPGGYEHTVYFLNLGMTSMNVPLDVRVIDQEGLAYPLAAHTDRLVDGRIGHDKNLYSDWVLVDTGMVDQHPWMPPFLDEKWVRQARTALSCPDTQALLASSRAPLTRERFRHNLLQAFHFAKYRIDRVPRYEIQRCHLVDPTRPPAPN